MREIREMMGVSKCVATSLLLTFKWNKEKLMTKFFEEENFVYKTLGVRPM